MNGVVIDTNVFVAAGFNSRSAAARILVAVRAGHFLLVWNKPTHRETETILHRIPGLDWARVADLFRPEGEFTGPVDPDVMIADRDDRKFVALSAFHREPAAEPLHEHFQSGPPHTPSEVEMPYQRPFGVDRRGFRRSP
jgi:hypothetical protein